MILTHKFEDVPRGAYRAGEKISQLIETYDVATFQSDITFINLYGIWNLHWTERGQVENAEKTNFPLYIFSSKDVIPLFQLQMLWTKFYSS